MIFTIDFHSRSPFLPSIKIPCYRDSLGKEETESLRNFVLEEESNILKNTALPAHEEDPTWLTGRLWHYNLLDYETPLTQRLEKWIGQSYEDFAKGMGFPVETVYIQVWANVVRPGGRLITKHNHAGAHINAPPENAYVSGNIFLGSCRDTKTFYQNPFLDKRAVGVPNIPGMMIMFPSYVDHWIDGTNSDLDRVSIAFDILTQSTYDVITAKNFRPLKW